MSVSSRGSKFLVVSSVAEKKNPINLIKAAAKLKEDGFLFSIVWAGATYISSTGTDVIDACQLLIKEYNLEKNFVFLGEVRDVYKLYSEVDWLVHPAFYEGLPNAICEAISVGLPVVASNVCDHPFLIDATRGILFDPYDVNSIYEALVKSINTPDEQYFSYSKNSVVYYENQLEVHYMINNYISLLSAK
jgi:glycosyltransferase involved in cell wall biosynthesis